MQSKRGFFSGSNGMLGLQYLIAIVNLPPHLTYPPPQKFKQGKPMVNKH